MRMVGWPTSPVEAQWGVEAGVPNPNSPSCNSDLDKIGMNTGESATSDVTADFVSGAKLNIVLFAYLARRQHPEVRSI